MYVFIALLLFSTGTDLSFMFLSFVLCYHVTIMIHYIIRRNLLKVYWSTTALQQAVNDKSGLLVGIE